jgi:hypothetical protein
VVCVHDMDLIVSILVLGYSSVLSRCQHTVEDVVSTSLERHASYRSFTSPLRQGRLALITTNDHNSTIFYIQASSPSITLLPIPTPPSLRLPHKYEYPQSMSKTKDETMSTQMLRVRPQNCGLGQEIARA